MPMLESRWGMPWASNVVATDACLGGYAYCSAPTDSHTHRSIGIHSERSRYKRGRFGDDAARARRVLDLNPFSDPRTVTDEVGDLERLLPCVDEVHDFPEISLNTLDARDWHVHHHAPFRRREVIHVLEARTQRLGTRSSVRHVRRYSVRRAHG